MAISGRDLTLILRVQSAGTGNIRALSRDLAALERSGLSFNERFARASQALSAFGRQAQLAGGIATAALGFAANSAANLQTQVTLAATQVGNTTGQVAKVATRDFQGILNQMTKFPTASSDMAGALYDIYSTLNVTSKQGLPILAQINKAAVAFGLTARDAGNGLLTVMSNFKEIPQTAGGAEKAFTRLGAAVRFGRLTMQQLQTALQTTAPAAKIAGQSLNNMAGTIAFLSRSLGASKASVGYARLVEVLSGQQMQDGLKGMGVNIDTANGKMKQLDQVVQILVKRFPYLAKGGIQAQNFFKTIGNLQGTIQARRAFATLVKDVGGYRDILHKTVKDNNEFKKSYDVMAKSLGIQWGVLINTLKSIAMQIGLAVIPAFVEMAKPIKEAIAWFEKLDPSVKATIGRFAAFGSVIALVGGTIITMVAGLAVAVTSIAELGGAASIFVTGAAAYGSLAALGVRIYQNWDALKGLFMSLGKTLLAFFRSVGQAVQAFLRGDWSNVWSHLGDAVKQGTSALLQSLNIMKISTLKWLEDFAFTLQGAMTAAIAGMFAVNKFRGRSKLAEGVGSRLSTADLLSTVLPLQMGVLGKGATKADDIAQALKGMPVLGTLPFLSGRAQKVAGAEVLKSGDMKKIAAAAPFLPAQQRMIAEQIIANDKIANSFKMRATNAVSAAKAELTMNRLQRQGINDLLKTSTRTGFSQNPMWAMLGMGSPQQTTRMSTSERTLRKFGAAAKDTFGTVARTGGQIAKIPLEKFSSQVKDAGKGLLNFLGFGISPYLGGVVAAAAGTYVLIKAVQHFFPTTQTLLDNEQKTVQAFHDSAQAATDSINAYIQAKDAQRQTNAAWTAAFKAAQNAKGGTDAYRAALDRLSKAASRYGDSAKAAADATKNLNDTFSQNIQNVQKVPTASLNVLAHQHQQNAQFVGTQVVTTPTYSPQQIQQAKAQAASYFDSLKQITTGLVTQKVAGQALTTQQLAYVSSVQKLAQQYPAIKQFSTAMAELTPNTEALAKAMGRVPQNLAAFAAFANSVPQKLKPAVAEFMKITHLAPRPQFAMMLDKIAQKSVVASKYVAGVVAATTKMPTTKDFQIFVKRPAYLQKWIVEQIAHLRRMPSQKSINVEIKAHDKATKPIKDVEKQLSHLKKMEAQSHIQISRSGRGDPFSGQIKNAQRDLKNLKAPKLKGIFQFAIKGDAFKALPQQAKAAETKSATAFGPLPKKIAALGTPAGQMFGTNFSVAASKGAKVSVTVLVHAYRQVIKASSPSKLFRDEVGDPIIQGILQPLKDKKTISDAANTAMDNMVSAFNANKDTFQQQMGDIFQFTPTQGQTSLQDIASWGGKLNIGQLRQNLSEQVHSFTRFQSSLRQLNRRRGANSQFIEMLRQLGPQNQAEIDALLRSPDKAFKQYVKLWERGQRAVTKAAKVATGNQIKQWRSQGAAVALGFMSGMESHSAAMARYFRRLFLHLFDQVKHVHKSHSPSKLYMDEGMRVAQGFQIGVARGLLRPVGGFGRPLAASVGGGHTYNTTYNIHQAKDESLLGTMRRHDFITRTRR